MLFFPLRTSSISVRLLFFFAYSSLISLRTSLSKSRWSILAICWRHLAFATSMSSLFFSLAFDYFLNQPLAAFRRIFICFFITSVSTISSSSSPWSDSDSTITYFLTMKKSAGLNFYSSSFNFYMKLAFLWRWNATAPNKNSSTKKLFFDRFEIHSLEDQINSSSSNKCLNKACRAELCQTKLTFPQKTLVSPSPHFRRYISNLLPAIRSGVCMYAVKCSLLFHLSHK